MRHRRAFLIATGAMAILLMVTATAFACTVFKGTFTTKGNASSTSVTGTGTATGMSGTWTSGIAKATKTAGSVTLSTGKDIYGRALPTRNGYLIRYYNSTAQTSTDGTTGPGFDKHTHWNTDCMAGGPGKQIGTADVGSDGKIVGQPRTYSLGDSANTDPAPTNPAGSESAVCISDNGGAFGNQDPVSIVL